MISNFKFVDKVACENLEKECSSYRVSSFAGKFFWLQENALKAANARFALFVQIGQFF